MILMAAMLMFMMIMSNEVVDVDDGVYNAIGFWLLAEKNSDYKFDGL